MLREKIVLIVMSISAIFFVLEVSSGNASQVRKDNNQLIPVYYLLTGANYAPYDTVIVDDYEGKTNGSATWYYSRIGTDRGKIGSEERVILKGGGSATATVNNGSYAGVWTSLLHKGNQENELLSPVRLLGPYIKNQFQAKIRGIEIDIIDGSGTLKVELKAGENFIFTESQEMTGGQQTLKFFVSPTENLKLLNWVVVGNGRAVVDELRLLLTIPKRTVSEAVFLFSYGHMSQCYDPATGLVRDRARWPTENFSAVQAMGTFALATAVAHRLGYVEKIDAENIVTTIKTKILSLPRYRGLLPHFITNDDITEDTEWSSVDTAISLVSLILACQSLDITTDNIEEILSNIDWNDLTDNWTRSVSHGYDYNKNKIANRWDVFGSESFILAVAYAAATGRELLLEQNENTPTWNGSGFNDEMASLFFPMDCSSCQNDIWGNNWQNYRREAFLKQKNYFSGHYYNSLGLFGLSASEVPEPWTVHENDVYGAWGVGGHNNQPNDGTPEPVGYPVIAPHYAAMVAKENPQSFNTLFSYLLRNKIFTPLNNVESFGVDTSKKLHWNSLKGSWNLSLQTLGVGRALSGNKYLPYQALNNNTYLKNGFDKCWTQ